MALFSCATTEVGEVHAALSLAEKDLSQPLALIIKHSGFGRRRDTKENHSETMAAGLGNKDTKVG